jgi:hypothetical protein
MRGFDRASCSAPFTNRHVKRAFHLAEHVLTSLYANGMKILFAVVIAFVLFLNGCAALMDGKFVTQDGKESPFQKHPSPYELPRDPTQRW